ncbi:caspase family protein [Pseudomarimonas arenosa]|uniref:Caspase family protein n=1 Tax=Pseudomarimonas arenosa TaxID=2774145 RepID=A0AAW3ZTX2_9GAMM|nr:caspase family protein [Pseudomarimonas arenosa]MBD8527546.1 caspase family protein [Pseudomarimonas arenosa]
MLMVGGAGVGNVHASREAFPTQAEDVLVVDCLLPGQVRRVGKIKSFLSQRRPARLSQFECAYRGGEFVDFDRANLQTAVSVWQQTAELGDADAMNILGEAYAKGMGVPPDYDNARNWFERAAAAGSRKALQNLGHLYENGLGVEADRTRALEYFRQALGERGESLVYSSDAVNAQALRDELEQLRLSSQQQKAELQALKQQAESGEAELGEARAALRKLRAEYQQLKERTGGEQQAEIQGVWRILEEQLRQQEADILTKQGEIERLRQGIDARQNPAPYVQLGPELALTLERPEILPARGRPVAFVAEGQRSFELRGSVTPASAAQSLSIDGVAVALREDGTFNTLLNLDMPQRSVAVIATSQSGGETRAEFLLMKAERSAVQGPGSAGQERVPRPKPAILRTTQYRGLLIAVSGYRHYPPLPTPRADVELLAGVLRERFNFDLRIVTDPTRLDMLLALHEFRQSMGANDAGLLYFAGHGEIDAEQRGYWIPSDASPDDRKSWIANGVITDILAVSEARHILVMADSCYSGTLTRVSVPVLTEQLSAQEWNDWASLSAQGKSRLALTSGGLRPVPEQSDQSVSTFVRSVVDVLRETPGTIEAQRLYRAVSSRLAGSPSAQAFAQKPELSPLQFAGHEGGEIFLVPR